MIVAQGTLNTSALVVPDLYVQIVPPQVYLINGQPTNIIGVVGTASWGPVDQPVIIGDMQAFVLNFGTPVARRYDLGTHVATAIQQGASNFRCVRVSDGTDTAATVSGPSGCIDFTALYTGSLGNNIVVKIQNGSKANSWAAVVGVPGGQPEKFDNITGTGNAFWVNLANAINTGAGQFRGKSQLIRASAGAGTTAPSEATYNLTSGTDGASGVDATALVGADSTVADPSQRTGMYALRNQGCGLLVISDCDTPAQWTVIDEFALSESCYAIQTGPSGDTISNAVTTKQTAGLDSYASKMMFGDWLWWADPFNGFSRFVSPQGFVAGRLANLSPEQSSLNKQIFGIAGSQKAAGTIATYSTAELTALELAGIDVVTNPGGGGLRIWTCRIGHNSSSNEAVHGDNYTRLTNFIAAGLNNGMGVYLGRLINDDLSRDAKATLTAFFMNMLGQGMLSPSVDDGGLPFVVKTDIGPGTINPPERTKLGYFEALAQVQYSAINEKFIVNIEGGQTVTISRQTLPTGQVTV